MRLLLLNNRKILSSNMGIHLQRGLASNSSFKSSHVRSTFLDFFSSHPKEPHIISKSIKVVPPNNDPTLPFVNAGMNAFKGVFLGKDKPPGSASINGKSSVANSQKCVRVGGKHNDLESVGTDGTHHTFFEMLGNWAFNQAYFKEEACSMAWELLTGPYGLPKEKLFVTYFGGSDELGPDLHTRDIWRGLGLKHSHILPFGAKDNFWEMGAAGPCGPCTEIHFDHAGLGPKLVNAGNDHLVEIWNLVFMEFNRLLDGRLEPLPRKHVDTGMGFERLTAVLNGKTSNYNTDLFRPLFEVMTKQTKMPEYSGSFSNPLDTNYRILSDHSRMISVCLSDGMFPESSPKLKQVLRRALRIAKQNFIRNTERGYTEFHLLSDLCRANVDILGDAYPELVSNLDRVNLILEFEADSMRQQETEGKKFWSNLVREYPKAVNLIELSECKQFHEGLKFVSKNITGSEHQNVLPGDLAYRIYESLGLREDQIETLAVIKGLSFSRDDFHRAQNEAKLKSKLNTAIKSGTFKLDPELTNLPPTNDSLKYNYSCSDENHIYEFPILSGAKILALTGPSFEPKFVLKKDESGILFLDKTIFYSEAGGQTADVGEIVSESGSSFLVKDCQVVGNGQIAHIGIVKKGRFSLKGSTVDLKMNTDHRLKTMQAHTGTHLLNGVLHSVLPLTCQKSSSVGAGHFKFDFAVFKQDVFGSEILHSIEEKVNEIIASKLPITREVLESSRELSKYENSEERSGVDLTKSSSQSNFSTLYTNEKFEKKLITIPGEFYPESNLSLIHTPLSIEPCCGTHLHNTGHVQGFVVISLKSPSSGVRSVKCVVGPESIEIRERGISFINEMSELQDEFEKLFDHGSKTEAVVDELSKKVEKLEKKLEDKKYRIPFTVRLQLTPLVTDLSRNIKLLSRSSSQLKMEGEMSLILTERSNEPFIIHYFSPDVSTSKVSLSKMTRMCQDKPILLMAKDQDDYIVARACVPKNLISKTFNARQWLTILASDIDGKVVPPKGQDSTSVVNMKAVPIPKNEAVIKKCLQNLRLYAENVAR